MDLVYNTSLNNVIKFSGNENNDRFLVDQYLLMI